MGAKMVSLRLDEELLEWADAYAKERGVSRTALLESALASFRVDAESGVPELREAARRQSSVEDDRGVGDCPERPDGFGHVWSSAKVDSSRPCRFCGALGRGRRNERGEVVEPGFFEGATSERALLYARLRAPESAHGRAKKP
jgi:predicted transcriptional regulator